MNIKKITDEIESLPLKEKVDLINELRAAIHGVSPFKNEPVDFVRWVKTEELAANSYNPNTVFSPEMDLLKLSIDSNGYTQPVVVMKEKGFFETVDGAHRGIVAKTYEPVRQRLFGYAPIVQINPDMESLEDRMAATVRHNRARGKHNVESMSDIVMHLKKRNWNDAKIAKHLGMDADEVLRLCQVTGLASLFADREFSEAWEAELETNNNEQIS